MKINKEEKMEILEGIVKELKRVVVTYEVNVRHINRRMMLAKKEGLLVLKRQLDDMERQKKELEEKLEVAQDELNDISK
jgi:ureidoglycolate hydrolase